MAQFLKRAPMAVEGGAAFGEQEVGVVFEAAFGGNPRLQLAERARGGVARIGEAGEALGVALAVEAFEGAAAHNGFTADFEARERALHAQRKGADGAGIFGYVFAHRAVSTGDGLGKFAVAIVGGHGESVQFELGDVAVWGDAEEVADAAVEIAELTLVEGVIEAEQRRAVLDLDESLARLSTDALGGGVRREQLGMLGLQRLEPAHQLVVFGVGDLGSVEDVVLLLVVAQLFGELLDLARGIFHWPLIYNLTRDRSPYHYNLQEYRTHLQPPGGQGHTERRRTDPACGGNSQTARAQRHGGADHGAEYGGRAGARACQRRGGPDRGGGRRRHHQ